MNKKGFSIMESLVAAMIFSIGVVGVFAAMSSQKAPSEESDDRIKAALAGKQLLESLRSKVNAADYAANTGELSLGAHNVSLGTWTATYTVTNAGNNVRKVDLTITW
jgi:prepilin-type N-terminal cleavage/methylation domain-containing protein